MRAIRTTLLGAGCLVAAAIPARQLSAAGAAEPAKTPDMYSAFRLYYGITAPSDPSISAPGLYTQLARTAAVPLIPFLGLDLEAAFSFLPGPSGSFGELFTDTAVGLGQLGLGLSARFRLSEHLRLYARGSGGGAAALDDYRTPLDAGYYYSGAAGLGFSFYDAFALGIEARYSHVDGFDRLLCAAAGLEFNLATVPRSRAGRAAAGRPQEDAPRASESFVRGAARPVPIADNVPVAAARSQAVAVLTKKVRESPHTYLEQLVRELTAASVNDFDKARAIHDWIAMSIAYDTAAFSGASPKIVDPIMVMQRGASVCQGYSNVFQLMCNRAGLDCAVVPGYGRGVGFDPFRESDPPYDSNHAWNAVRIDGHWYLVDCTWDAGSVDSTMVFNRRYSNQYLFADPQGFLHTHFPGAPAWQLVDRPISYQEFCRKPYLKASSFQHGVSIDPDTPRVVRVDDSAAVSFKVPPGAALQGFLERADGSSVSNSVRVDRNGEDTTVQVRFPAPGRYRLDLFVGPHVAGGASVRAFRESMVHAGCLVLEAARASSEMFPRGY